MAAHGSSRSRTWWIVPYFGGLLAVVVVAAAVIAIRPALRSSAHSAATHPPANSTATGAPLPAEMFPGALFGKLTAALAARNEAGFLALAAPGARAAMKTWWGNQAALGFITGAVIPTASHDTVRIDGHGDGSTTVLAGVHNPLDPVIGGKPDVVLGRYRIGLHFASPTAIGQITSWQPLGSDPLDSAGLYVRQGTDVIVAGPPTDSGLVDETLPLAQAAATYDLGLLRQVNPNDLAQEGFVVFVSGNSVVRSGWFAADPQPPGWPLAWHGDRVFQFPGPGSSPDDYTSAPAGLADASTGGARVVVTPYEQSGQTPELEILALVREFMIDILSAHDQELVNGPGPASGPPAWTIEGLGIAAEALYSGNSNPAPASYSFGPLPGDLSSLPASYRAGQLPDAEQLAGPSAPDWNDVAASVYEYISQTYGMNQMLASAALLWTRYPMPFGNVEDTAKSSASTFAFFTSATVLAGWKAWLARA